jgi:serine/threonine-protein kinase 11
MLRYQSSARSLKFEPMLISDQEEKPQTKLNQYVLAGRLGRGANANVHLAIDCETGLHVAAKAIRLDGASALTLQREIRNMRKLDHPNIIRLLEVLHRRDTNTVYLILEYARGSLKGQRFTEPQAVSVFSQIVGGLLYLHSEGLVHQDIKPSNLLVFEGGAVKIADFGIGHSFASAEAVIGTPGYQAPEFLSDTESDPTKGDVWSLGVTIFESIFGRLPFSGETVYEIARESRKTVEIPEGASAELADLLTLMLCPDPVERISMADVAAHPFFAGAKQPVIEFQMSPPRMKVSKSLVCVAADVCDDEYRFAKPSQASSWPGPGRMGLRQFGGFVC